MAYAKDTTVPVERSRAEIEKLLRKHGATGFMSGWDEAKGLSVLQCRIGGRMLRFEVWQPDPGEFAETAGGRTRKPADARAAAQKEERRRWRAQVLIIKAKLELIESDMSTIEREFLADILLPDGSTLGDWAAPQIEAAYDKGSMPKLLPGGK